MKLRAVFIFLLPLLLLDPLRADVDFRKDIGPILSRSCIDCHRAPRKVGSELKKPKGDLQLDGPNAIIKGGSEGPAVVAEDPDASPLYTRSILPPEHEDAMPPKGKGKALTVKESELIKTWILEGAKFGDWKGVEGSSIGTPTAPPGSSGSKTKPDALATGVSAADETKVKSLTNLGAQVSPVSEGNPLLRVEWVSGAGIVTDKEAAALESLAAQISELSLAKTKISDSSLTTIAKMTKLTWLNLSQTEVSDTGLAALKTLTNLTHINLFETKVSDTSLATLAGLKNLKSIHLYKSQVTSTGVDKLRKALPDARIQFE